MTISLLFLERDSRRIEWWSTSLGSTGTSNCSQRSGISHSSHYALHRHSRMYWDFVFRQRWQQFWTALSSSTQGYFIPSSTINRKSSTSIYLQTAAPIFIPTTLSIYSTALRARSNSEATGMSPMIWPISDQIFQDFQWSHLLEDCGKWAYQTNSTHDTHFWRMKSTPSGWTTRYVCAL